MGFNLGLAATLSFVLVPLLGGGGGGFYMSLGQPSAHPDPKARESAFVIKVSGCAASVAKLQVTAEGDVNGERRSIPVTPIALTNSSPGTENERIDWSVAVPKVWPSEGRWVIKVVGNAHGMTQTASVVLNETGIDRAQTKISQTTFTGSR